MAKKPTQVDVARLAGVSHTTVSYVINNHDGKHSIPEATRERVWEAIRELGYVPNQPAQHLRWQSTRRICVVLPRLGIPYNDMLINDLRSVLEENGFSIIITVADTVDQIEKVLVQMRGGLADGLFLELGQASFSDTTAIIRQLKDMEQSVIVSGNMAASPHFDVLTSNEGEAIYQAVEYLLQQGHERIAFLGHSIADLDKHVRYINYAQALRAAGIPIDPDLVRTGANSRQDALILTQHFLKLNPRPSAIFCTSDISAISALMVMRQAGLEVPHDMAVVGVGNIAEGEYTFPRLTTVGPRFRGFQDVAELLLKRLLNAEPLPPQIIVHEWHLIVREST